jgi:hypothetical protein
LGAASSKPISYTWVPGNPAPLVIPAIVLLGLLAVKKNRTGQAWLILLPLVIAFVLQAVLASTSGDRFEMSVFSEAILTGIYALTAFWLISFLVARKGLVVVFFAGAGLMVLFAAVRLLSILVMDGDWQTTVVASMLLGIALPLNLLGLVLGGWAARRQYRPGRVIILSLLVLTVGWFLAASPFFLISAFSRGDFSDFGEFVTAVGCAIAINTLALLPFIVLSMITPFYRERLKALLHLEREEPPVSLAVPFPVPPLPMTTPH